ncbi:NADH-dependent FMN reductase RutF [Saccharospirillum mangrovi]|uniref:NADH-dependent FMN reductase RutF n=1 Tax=Saccharospirillum mangrovi TaxID=2161747 RepID=UPI000D3CDD52|nr:pyrimidine utilization flavin reductase protein F [Saccharospirillum mangrovi]
MNAPAAAATEITPELNSQSYRDAMSGLAAAVNIVTTDGPGGRAGFTATAVCSVSDQPPTLLVCLNRSASAFPMFDANQALCVNTLTADQMALSNLFGGKTDMDERFAAAAWQLGDSGAPILENALVSFDCRIVKRVSLGTHDTLFCEVLSVTAPSSKDGLVYFDRGYAGLNRL